MDSTEDRPRDLEKSPRESLPDIGRVRIECEPEASLPRRYILCASFIVDKVEHGNRVRFKNRRHQASNPAAEVAKILAINRIAKYVSQWYKTA